MNHRIIRCEVCGRQIISGSTEDTDRTIGKDYGNGECLMLFKGVACPQCTPEELEWNKMMEGVA